MITLGFSPDSLAAILASISYSRLCTYYGFLTKWLLTNDNSLIKGNREAVPQPAFPSPGGRGLRGGGYNLLKITPFHPHPNPLPSRERECLAFLAVPFSVVSTPRSSKFHSRQAALGGFHPLINRE
jgi:hypothetical protein